MVMGLLWIGGADEFEGANRGEALVGDEMSSLTEKPNTNRKRSYL